MSDFKMVADVQFSGDTDVAITQNNSVTSDEIDLRNLKSSGFHALQIVTAGAGVVQVQVLCCATSGGTFSVPEDKDGTSIDDVVTAHAGGTNKYYGFPSMPIAPFIKIKVTENNTGAITSCQCRLVVQ